MHHTVDSPLLFIDHGEGRKGVHKALLGVSMLSLLALLAFLFLTSSASMRVVTFGDVGPGSGFHLNQKLRLELYHQPSEAELSNCELDFK